MKPRLRNGGTVWPSGFHWRSPDRLASVREIVWRWLSIEAASSCARFGEGTNSQNWSLRSHPRIVTGKQGGASPKALCGKASVIAPHSATDGSPTFKSSVVANIYV